MVRKDPSIGLKHLSHVKHCWCHLLFWALETEPFLMYSLQPAHTASFSCSITWQVYCFEHCIKHWSSTSVLDDSVCNYHRDELCYKQISGKGQSYCLGSILHSDMFENKSNYGAVLHLRILLKFQIYSIKTIQQSNYREFYELKFHEQINAMGNTVGFWISP